MTTTTPPAPSAKRGVVVLVLFPNADLRTARKRPALIVQADDLGTGLGQLIVAMITSRMLRAGHPSRVGVLLSSPKVRNRAVVVAITNRPITIAAAYARRVVNEATDNGMVVVNNATTKPAPRKRGTTCQLSRRWSRGDDAASVNPVSNSI